jgi:uncharacterized protein involved in response to NO
MTRDATGRWNFARLFLAPHRLAFASGSFVLVLASLWWAVVNVSVSEGAALPWGMAPSAAHGLVMTFGFMPMFFVGFLFTAGPKWLAQPAVDAAALLPALMPQVAGWLVFLLSVHSRDPAFNQTLGTLGLCAVTLGWALVLKRFVSMLVRSQARDKTHARLVAAGCAVGVLALAAAAWGTATQNLAVLRSAAQLGLWCFVGLVFTAVAHRMIPFFSAAAVPSLDAWRPTWLLWTSAAVFVCQGLFAAAEPYGMAAGPGWSAVRATVELSAGAGCLALAVRWGLVQSLRIRLLAMLHIGFSWLGAALLLFGVSHAIEAAGGPAGALGLAPLHAFTMGYLGSTMLAMVTRVSCGHGGRTLVADDFIWRLFWVLQAAVVLRLLAAVFARLDGVWALALVSAAAVGWAGVCCAWALRYGHWFGTPRPDGRPG